MHARVDMIKEQLAYGIFAIFVMSNSTALEYTPFYLQNKDQTLLSL